MAIMNSSSAGRPSNSPSSQRAWLYMLALSFQYGAQPILSKRFSGKEVIVTSAVLACEWAKVACALIALGWNGTPWPFSKDWSFSGALITSGLPSALYALQNTLLQLGYRNLDSLTFSMLNQTKLLFTALFMFIILGHKQSVQQIGALMLLLTAALLLSIGENSSKESHGSGKDQVMVLRVLPVFVASVLSGLASSLCQWAVQVKRRSSYMMTIEMSFFGSLCLLMSMLHSPDGVAIRQRGFFSGWTPLTAIPVFTNAVGGILVGLVTAYAGGVRKGFVIVSALIVTAFLQLLFDGVPPSLYALTAMPMVLVSVIIYQNYPYNAKTKLQ